MATCSISTLSSIIPVPIMSSTPPSALLTSSSLIHGVVSSNMPISAAPVKSDYKTWTVDDTDTLIGARVARETVISRQSLGVVGAIDKLTTEDAVAFRSTTAKKSAFSSTLEDAIILITPDTSTQSCIDVAPRVGEDSGDTTIKIRLAATLEPEPNDNGKTLVTPIAGSARTSVEDIVVPAKMQSTGFPSAKATQRQSESKGRLLFSTKHLLRLLEAVRATEIYKTVLNVFDFWLKAQVVQLLTGGLGNLPRSFSETVKYLLNRKVIHITYNNTDQLFNQITAWMIDQPQWKEQTEFHASSDELGRQSSGPILSQIIRPAHGKEDDKASSANLSPVPNVDYRLPFGDHHLIIRKTILKWSDSLSTVEEYKVTFPLNRQVVDEFHGTIRKAYSRRTKNRLLICDSQFEFGSRWNDRPAERKRSTESVHLEENVLEGLMEDMAQFLGAQELYALRSVPWRRCYLLHGPPGTGKTSVVQAMASHFDMKIHFLQPSSMMSDSNLRTLFQITPSRSIILIDDIDRAFPYVVEGFKGDPSSRTLKGLLDALDGLGSGNPGVITFITTNNKQVIDEAVLRPGRVDVQIELGYATADAAKRFFEHYYSEGTTKRKEEVTTLAIEFSSQLPENSTIAELVNYLGFGKNLGNPELAVKDFAQRLLAQRAKSGA
ncbi:hypothetical protein NP233_g9229 [Leucocoprinus birnbaumii]|uniref:AAA+ ATPase domain-containing protein n=1 Tax=Leucocoprinus birnbaumii TaxID=56174 RepID=A0AAD5YT14_9AGAR|nr:hypothetical protein NP233_g9229 [Leucocoprinus birnbaumii]